MNGLSSCLALDHTMTRAYVIFNTIHFNQKFDNTDTQPTTTTFNTTQCNPHFHSGVYVLTAPADI